MKLTWPPSASVRVRSTVMVSLVTMSRPPSFCALRSDVSNQAVLARTDGSTELADRPEVIDATSPNLTSELKKPFPFTTP